MTILIMQNRTQALKQWGIKTNGGIKHAKRSRYTNPWQLCLYKNVHKPLKKQGIETNDGIEHANRSGYTNDLVHIHQNVCKEQSDYF